jgi:hypothetical protein
LAHCQAFEKQKSEVDEIVILVPSSGAEMGKRSQEERKSRVEAKFAAHSSTSGLGRPTAILSLRIPGEEGRRNTHAVPAADNVNAAQMISKRSWITTYLIERRGKNITTQDFCRARLVSCKRPSSSVSAAFGLAIGTPPLISGFPRGSAGLAMEAAGSARPTIGAEKTGEKDGSHPLHQFTSSAHLSISTCGAGTWTIGGAKLGPLGPPLRNATMESALDVFWTSTPACPTATHHHQQLIHPSCISPLAQPPTRTRILSSARILSL